MSEHDITNLPVNIQIGTLSGNSGVYVGKQVTAYGISSHSKVNKGFGDAGDSNLLYCNLSYVYDPDLIDAPIDDRDVHIFQPQPAKAGKPSITNIGVGDMFINTMQQNSGAFIGTTNITGMDSHEKQNFGHGHGFGNRNFSYRNLNIAHDHDLIDAIINDQDNKASVFHNT